MKNSILANYYHNTSTDEEPMHHFCKITWCFYLKYTGILVGPMQSHDTGVHRRIREDLAKKVKEVYNRLTEDSLLDRCLQGKTQNANEALHAVIWSIYPKIHNIRISYYKYFTLYYLAE